MNAIKEIPRVLLPTLGNYQQLTTNESELMKDESK